MARALPSFSTTLRPPPTCPIWAPWRGWTAAGQKPTWLARQPPEALALLRLQPHPGTRWQWCADHPAYTLWQRQREGLPWDAALPWQGEGALLTRPHDAVQWAPLPHAGCALLDACAAGASFEDAAAQALQADPAAALSQLVALLLHSGALRAPEIPLN